jgi:hypothetical protein
LQRYNYNIENAQAVAYKQMVFLVSVDAGQGERSEVVAVLHWGQQGNPLDVLFRLTRNPHVFEKQILCHYLLPKIKHLKH